MNKVLAFLLALAGIWLVAQYINANPTSQNIYTEPSRAEVNQSTANLNNATAAEINQRIRRQNEFDDGTSINAFARVISGNGITDAERLFSTGMLVLFALFAFPWVLLGILFVIFKLSKS